MSQLPPIVSPEWLATELSPSPGQDPGALKLADVRWYLDGRSGHDAYLRAHIPGAVFIDMDEVLAAPASTERGRHPLPAPEVFARGLAEVGIGESDRVVAYDDLGGMVAGRLVWMLRILGAPAALLDGGLPGWTGEPATGQTTVVAASRRPKPWPTGELAGADDVAELAAGGGVVIDARAPERYRGEQEPVDRRAGHIPGAVNLPFASNLDDRQRFKPASELGRRFSDAGADGDAIVYCGSGVSACHNVLAMEAAGLERPRLFVGSWSQWSADETRPAATGSAP